ncbi:UDP-N-acetylmuramoyl-L-alanyl-D-glutamate--2,6-diaminopimelate ligase MurE homolog, chloroplastic-like [Vigna umbellata]|uniref:UDP-N-acetylmuramoyl-L-alanyl-D-glutamate--2, 6-diaminopimelate ligase MurE homolog, chloroplastic-like n=1 Tax=Vigna umbellata TaxID=87088 RepID=UPI001F5F9463|nr:UDP-N-acetylmuramoyl-L-alanyl-D-glutamate--2,6-diaminopimelate ligase MurE homolog, chloroplastic-like [Vigna umbellata]
MALSFLRVSHLLSPTPTPATATATATTTTSTVVKFQHFRRPSDFTLFFRSSILCPLVRAIGPDGRFYPSPGDDDPPEAAEDSSHGFSTFQQIQQQAERARQIEEED